MAVTVLSTKIKAPIERCFDLSRSIELHKLSTAHTNEEAIDGVTTGLIKLDEHVTWKATHFGISQKLTSKITEFQRPSYFIDEMIQKSTLRHNKVPCLNLCSLFIFNRLI